MVSISLYYHKQLIPKRLSALNFLQKSGRRDGNRLFAKPINLFEQKWSVAVLRNCDLVFL